LLLSAPADEQSLGGGYFTHSPQPFFPLIISIRVSTPLPEMISLFFLSILQKMAKFTQMLLGREHSLSCLSLFNGSIILFKEEESGHSLQNASSFLGIRNGEPPWPYLPHTLRHKDMEAHATLERIETRWQYSRIYMCNNRYYDNDMIRFAVKHAQHYTILDNNLSGKNRNRMGRT